MLYHVFSSLSSLSKFIFNLYNKSILRYKQVNFLFYAGDENNRLLLSHYRGIFFACFHSIDRKFLFHYFIADEVLSSGNRDNNCPPWSTRSRRYPIVRRILARDTRYFSSSRIFVTFAYCDHPVVSRIRSLEHT